MKTINSLLILSFSSLFLCSCGTVRVYRNGSQGSLKTYVAKPEFNGEQEVGTYISGSVASGKQKVSGPAPMDVKTIFSFQAHRSHTTQKFNYYYGLGGSYGTYKFESPIRFLVEEGTTDPFYNLSLLTGGNFNKSTDKMDFRIIGLELRYDYEFGPYQDRLKELDEQSITGVVIKNFPTTISTNIYTEIVLKFNTKKALGVGFFYGGILNHGSNQPGSGFGGITASFRYGDVVLSYVWTDTAQDITTSRFGLTYQLF